LWFGRDDPRRDDETATTRQHFDEWLRAERADTAWLQSLPPVYSRLLPGNRNPEPEDCHPRRWPVLRPMKSNFHPGAAWEMRSTIQADGSGHQATYDAQGNLIRTGAGVGTADRASPRPYQLLRLLAHRNRDVKPFVWAAQLDGNPVQPALLYSGIDRPITRMGEHIADYLRVRPPFPSARREIEPGVCIDGVAPRQQAVISAPRFQKKMGYSTFRARQYALPEAHSGPSSTR
jgi:YD repeat-containing protein